MNDCCCKEKLRLLFKYRNATNVYSTRIALMAEFAGGSLPKAEFASLSKAANLAYEKCIEAHERFYKHLAEHGC